jgi:hypothetical protein
MMLKWGVMLAVLGIGMLISPAGEMLASDVAEPEADETTAPGETSEEREVTRQDLLEQLDEVHGKRGRRLFKAAYWAAGLEGDMKVIYQEHGHPSGRYREVKAGVVFETWTYLDTGKRFVFRDGEIAGTRDFNPGSVLGIYLK